MAGEEEQHLRKPASSVAAPATALAANTCPDGAKRADNSAGDGVIVKEALEGGAVDADLEEVVDREVEAAGGSTLVASPASSSSGASSASSPLPQVMEEEEEDSESASQSAVSSPMERSNAGSKPMTLRVDLGRPPDSPQ